MLEVLISLKRPYGKYLAVNDVDRLYWNFSSSPSNVVLFAHDADGWWLYTNGGRFEIPTFNEAVARLQEQLDTAYARHTS